MTAATIARHRHRKPSRRHRLAARWHRLRARFQWPCWLLNWAWNRQATPYVRADPVSQEDIDAWVRTGVWPGYEDGEATKRPGLAARWRTTDGRERDDTPAESSRTARGDGTPPPGTQVAGRQAATGRRAVESRADPRAAGATASRGAQPPAPGLLRRCRIAAFWLLAVLGDWRLNWRTWREDRRDGTDLASARIWLDRLRGIGPLTAARTRLAAVRAVVPAALPAATPGHHEDPHVTVTGEVAAAALPCEPLYPLRDDPRWPHLDAGQLGDTSEFTALIGQMTPPAHVAGQF